MKRELLGDMISDTSVLVELLAGTRVGKFVYDELRSGSIRLLITELNEMELRYIVCRKAGIEKYSEIVGKLLNSGYVKVVPIGGLINYAALLKCTRTISLVDCFTIALGEKLKMDVVFAKHEDELDREIRRKPFETEILFIEDLMK